MIICLYYQKKIGIIGFLNRGDLRHRVTQGHLAGQNQPSVSGVSMPSWQSLLGSKMLQGLRAPWRGAGPMRWVLWWLTWPWGKGRALQNTAWAATGASRDLGPFWEGKEQQHTGSRTKIILLGSEVSAVWGEIASHWIWPFQGKMKLI